MTTEISEDSNIDTVSIPQSISQQLRRHVDNDPISFDLKLTYLSCFMIKPDLLEMRLFSASSNIKIQYEKCTGGCRVTLCDKVRFLENCDFAEVAGNEIGSILKNQDSEMRAIIVEDEAVSDGTVEPATARMLQRLVQNLGTRKPQTRELCLRYLCNEQHIMSLLPHLDSSKLDTVWILDSPPLEMDRITSTEQWKNCNIRIHRAICKTTLNRFHHFKGAQFEISEISSNDLFLLKEFKLQNPSFQEFKFKYVHLTDPRNLIKVLGKPYHVQEEGCQRWFYRIPNDNKVLVVERNARGHKFELKVKCMDDVPADAFG